MPISHTVMNLACPTRTSSAVTHREIGMKVLSKILQRVGSAAAGRTTQSPYKYVPRCCKKCRK
jgi:hypothetical protein